MKLRTKTIIIISVIALLVFVSLHFIASLIILPGFRNLEKQESGQNVFHVLNVIDYKVADLSGKTNDYASWDDTYNFVQQRNQNYLETNFMDSTFENMNINLAILFDPQGSIVYCQSFDLLNKTKVPTSEATQEVFKTDIHLWNFSIPDDRAAGIILLSDQPMYIASEPILTSQDAGPIMGTLLFGEYINEEECNTLSTLTNLDVSIFSLKTLSSQQKEQLQPLIVNNQTILTKESSSEQVTGYYLMDDLKSDHSIVLQVSQSRTAYQQGLGVMYLFLAASLALSVFLGIAVTVFLDRSVIKPLDKLTSYVRGVSPNSDNQKAFPKFGTEETAILANAVKDTLTQKLDTIGEMAGMVGHDLRNPLTGIKGAAYVLKKNCNASFGDNEKEMIRTIENCVEYSDKIVSDLLEYSRAVKLDLTETTPKRLVDTALSTLQVPKNIELTNETSDKPIFKVDIGKIQRVFTNVIKNAFDAMPDGGQIKISSKRTNGHVQITFSDNGLGMSEETLKKLWVPFFTTKAKGMGFGLPICKRMVEAHGGKIQIESSLGKGAEIAVSFPAS